jgi:hypothetical protein
MSEENNQSTLRTESTNRADISQQQMDMNSLIRNLMESVVGVADQTTARNNRPQQRECEQECEEDCDCDDEEDEDDDEEDDDEDFFEVDDNFRWKTLGELVESHNRLTRAYLKMVSRRD